MMVQKSFWCENCGGDVADCGGFRVRGLLSAGVAGRGGGRVFCLV